MEHFIAENYDKWLHFLISASLSLWLIFLPKTSLKKWIGFGVCVLIAAGKELVIDLKLGYGTAEWLDFLATMIIPLIALIVSLKINKE